MSDATSWLKKINWKSFLLAGLAANAAKTVAVILVGKNPLMNGPLLLPEASQAVQMIVGLTIWIIAGQGLYGLIYVIFFHPVKVWNRFWKAMVGALAMAYLAIVDMPYFPATTWEQSLRMLFVFFVFTIVMVYLYKAPPEESAAGQEPAGAMAG